MLRAVAKKTMVTGYLKDVFGGNPQPLSARAIGDLPVRAGLQAWYDASISSSITDAGSGHVSQWNDISGNLRHAVQATDGTRPITGARTINSKNVLDFNGAQWLQTELFCSLRPSSFFMVGQWDGTTGQYIALGSAGGYGAWLNSGNSFCLYTVKDNTVAMAVATTQIPGNTAFSRGDILSSTQIFNYMKSVSVFTTSNSTAFTAGATLFLGASGLESSSFWWNGAIAEVAVYNQALSAGDATLVMGYLNAKWGTA